MHDIVALSKSNIRCGYIGSAEDVYINLTRGGWLLTEEPPSNFFYTMQGNSVRRFVEDSRALFSFLHDWVANLVKVSIVRQENPAPVFVLVRDIKVNCSTTDRYKCDISIDAHVVPTTDVAHTIYRISSGRVRTLPIHSCINKMYFVLPKATPRSVSVGRWNTQDQLKHKMRFAIHNAFSANIQLFVLACRL